MCVIQCPSILLENWERIVAGGPTLADEMPGKWKLQERKPIRDPTDGVAVVDSYPLSCRPRESGSKTYRDRAVNFAPSACS